MIYNRIPIAFGGSRNTKAPPISYQYDAVQYLVINGLDLPDYYTVEFCNEGDADTITITGSPTGVMIPHQLLTTGKDIIAYIILHGTDENAVETRYEVKIPVTPRPRRSDIQPIPAEQQQIDSLIDALNEGVNRSETAADAAELSETNAAESERNAASSEDAARQSELHAKSSEDVALASAQSAERSMTHAAESAYNARVSEVNAEQSAERAEQAATTAGYLDVDIDEHGHLIYIKTDAVDVDFDLVDGHLIMEAV